MCETINPFWSLKRIENKIIIIILVHIFYFPPIKLKQIFQNTRPFFLSRQISINYSINKDELIFHVEKHQDLNYNVTIILFLFYLI